MSVGGAALLVHPSRRNNLCRLEIGDGDVIEVAKVQNDIAYFTVDAGDGCFCASAALIVTSPVPALGSMVTLFSDDLGACVGDKRIDSVFAVVDRSMCCWETRNIDCLPLAGSVDPDQQPRHQGAGVDVAWVVERVAADVGWRSSFVNPSAAFPK